MIGLLLDVLEALGSQEQSLQEARHCQAQAPPVSLALEELTRATGKLRLSYQKLHGPCYVGSCESSSRTEWQIMNFRSKKAMSRCFKTLEPLKEHHQPTGQPIQ